MGTTQLASRVDQIWPWGRGLVGLVVEVLVLVLVLA
jgi:hypothetical protein